MDKILYLTLLYDFYGELLTEKQRDFFRMYYQNDLSMQEIAEQFEVTRQSVNDLLKRTEKILHKFENKLSLVSGHVMNMNRIENIAGYIDGLISSEQFNKGDLESIKEKLLELM